MTQVIVACCTVCLALAARVVTAQRPDKQCQHAKRCHTSNMDKQGLKPHRTKAYIETVLAR
ncbi:uncharacterized protein ASPGLDRAFT_52336 [Aspergillus glaucus CBS 516.65]|uniref:Secreted protein n=1 Tax=Aspergillus glaucus CBS 516.65 TaxID=1160497 RepID=A0A1L9V7B2_ASPGL|nr:hypothetical protein ASPGLDRAFT_52336 [Aspergillus glaucus CBS 516.65]OJJ79795.1 hypothetical protein ASPGLDRAFT_52336 [Aspergillus glaucus CBS 516.65]